jgi:hypothetical protein
MSPRRPRWCAAIAAAVLLFATVAHADAEVDYPMPATDVQFYAVATQAGVISLLFFGASGTPVVYYERIGDQLVRLGTRTVAPETPAVMRDAVTWRCGRLIRRFVAATVMPNGRQVARGYDVRTPSCATRFELRFPHRLDTGALGLVRVVDRWGNGGVTPLLCLTPPGGPRVCAKARLRRAVAIAKRRFRATTAGHWRVELRFRGHRMRRSITVGGGAGSSAPPPTVLATGDSTMLGIDSYLADELGDAAVVSSDARPGTGIIKPAGPWATLARTQTERLQQAATVISLGVVDAFPLIDRNGTKQECCGAGWIADYSRRVRSMMKTYLRHGRARVVWLTLPIPRGERTWTDAVNVAVLRAAQSLDRVTVVRLDLVFTPDGFREVMPYRGRDVRVRVRDGIHMTIAGSAIAAALVAAVLREHPTA